MMTISKQISQQINKFPEDILFGYKELNINQQDYTTAAKALERLQKKGVIKKISKGKFFKPKMTIFGEKKPSEEQILKPYLYKEGKRVAYITGTYFYNQLGLTTQIPSTIRIASRDKSITIKTLSVKASPAKSYVDVTEENYQILGFLDAIKDLKQIPDVDITLAIRVFQTRIKQLNEKQTQGMVEYALAYPSRVRALLGAILEAMCIKTNIELLRKSLNPLSSYKLGINTNILPTASNWNIQ